MKLNKVLALALTAVMALSLAGCGADQAASINEGQSGQSARETASEPVQSEMPDDEEAVSYTIEGKTYPMQRCFDDSEEPVESDMTLFFINGGDIPYVRISDYIPMMTELFSAINKGEIEYSIITPGKIENTFTVTRSDNDSYLVFNTKEDTITLSGSNFTNDAGATALVTVMDLPEPGKGEQNSGVSKMFRASSASFNQFGEFLRISLADYNIDMISEGDECYVPLQTMNDLLLSEQYIYLVFNGEKLICAAYGTDFINEMYTAKPQEMSPEYAAFNSNELMLLLDNFYGLKEEHNIKSFRSMVQYNGAELNGLYHNTDPVEFDNAMIKLTLEYMDDGHSAFSKNSWMSGDNSEEINMQLFSSMGKSTKAKFLSQIMFAAASNKYYPEGVPGYEEIGNTAFITFNGFTMEYEDLDKYYELKEIDPAKDTIQLISYANQQIRREGSPVENVVLDLSMNGGGAATAAVFVISWFLGEANIAVRDVKTGSETIMSYMADINLDGTIDGNDSLLNSMKYNLYCLESGVSFSCGNLVPAAFKASGQVTLIGQCSGGGSCVVLPCTSASGTIFQMSGTKQLATVKNGSFYNIDQGIEPDIVFSKAESFFDRKALVEYINNIK